MQRQYTTSEAAVLTGHGESTLRLWRRERRKDAPAAIRVGGKVYYSAAELARWWAQRLGIERQL